jgi:hypothetical protein
MNMPKPRTELVELAVLIADGPPDANGNIHVHSETRKFVTIVPDTPVQVAAVSTPVVSTTPPLNASQ